MCDETSLHRLEAENQQLRAQLATMRAQHAYEAQFRRAMESIGAVFYLTDLTNNQVKYVSPAYERIWGRTPQSLYADISSFVAAVEEPYRPLVFSALERQLRGETTDIEYPVRRPDGSTSWVRDRAFAVMDENGAFQLVTGIVEDITEARETENRLRATERRYRDLFENAPVMYVLTDATPDGPVIADCNVSFCAALGYRREETIGTPLARYYSVESALELLQRGYQEALDHGISQVERSLVTATGDVIPCLLQAVPRLDDQQRLIGTLAAFVDIAGRKQAEQALAASEANFRSLVESSESIIAVVERSGRILYVNSAGIGLTGDATIAGKLVDEIYPVDTPEQSFTLQIQRMIDAQSSGILELTSIVPLGTLWFRVSVTPLRNAEGTVDRALISALDITREKNDLAERTRTAEALRESEQRYRSLIESSEAGIAIIDGNSTYLYMNQIAASILGSTPESLTGRSMYEIFPPENAHAQAAVIRQVIATGEGVIDEAPTRVAAGLRWFRTSIQPLCGAAGMIDRVMISTFDVTERKETERILERRVEERTEEIRRLAELQRAVVDNAGLAIITTDADGIVQTFNPEAERMLGYSAGEVIGKMRTASFHAPEEMAQFGSDEMARLDQATQSQPRPIECTYVRKDGTRLPVLLTVSALRDSSGKITGLLGIAADITLRKHAEMVVREREETLRLANIELARANRAKDEFLASMSHELRTPLNNIAVLAEILREELRGPLNHWQLKSVQSIDKSARHLLALINDVLDIAKIEADKIDLNLEPIAVLAACQSSLAFVRETAQKKGLTLDYPAVPAELTVIADERRLKQILVNLLSNAVKFTPTGGRVSLQVSADSSEGFIRLVVEDTGIGIAAKDLSLIFAPFSQVDSSLTRQHEGTGLGLSLVKQLVDMHGGSVTVTSTVGKGSCFSVTLPWKRIALEVAGDNASETISTARPVSEEHEVILLADDNEINTASLSEYLELSGYRVVVARDGADALAKAETENPHLILMDIQMPAMDGLEATRRLRANQRFAATPIIALTALAMAGDRDRCLAAGATEYMSKPLSPRAVVDTIRRLLDANA
jgi:PAS domain S-box-containing protein